MSELVLSTKHLPEADRKSYFREMTKKVVIPTWLSDDDSAFQAETRLTDLGVVRVFSLSYQPLEVRRTPKMIRRFDHEQYHVSLILRGSMRHDHLDRIAIQRAGELVICDSSRPSSGRVTAADGPVEQIVAHIPKYLFPLPDKDVTRLLATTLPGHSGITRLVARYLQELAADPADRSLADSSRLANITVDLVMTLCAHELEAQRSLPAESRRQALLTSVFDFIARHLPDPRLCPETIARAHQISLRYLHKLFRAEGLTVAGWIRHQRLERCRRDLADPRLRERSINAIATRWGFGNAAHFSRLFRTAYGLPPRDYRHLTHAAIVREHQTPVSGTATT